MRSVFRFMKGNIRVLTVTNSMWIPALRMTFPFFSLYVIALGGSLVEIGLVNVFRALASLFLYPIAGYAADRWGRVKMIGLSRALFSLTYLLFIFAIDWRMLAAGSFLLGIFIFHYPATSAITADSLSPEQRGVGFATLMAIPGYFAFTSPFIAGYLVTKLGVNLAMRYIYAIALICGCSIGIILFKFLRETIKGSEPRPSLQSLPSLIKEAYTSVWEGLRWMPKELKALTIIMAINMFFNWIAAPFWVVYGVTEIKLTELEWGLIMLCVSVLREVLFIPAGILVDRIGKRRSLLAVLAVSVLPVFLFVYCRTFLQALTVLLVISVVNAFLMPIFNSLMADIVPRERRGRIMAALGRGMLQIRTQGGTGGGPGVGLLLAIPEMLGSLASGYVYRFNPTFPWLFLSSAIIVSLFLTIILIKDPTTPEV